MREKYFSYNIEGAGASLSIHTPYSILRISHFLAIEAFFDHFLIRIESRSPAFELEKDNLSESSLREAIEYNVIYPLPHKNHILRGIWKGRKSGEDFLIDFPHDDRL